MTTITPETLYEFKYLSNPRISPDGRYTMFAVKQANKTMNSYDANIYIMDNETKSIRQLTKEGDVIDCIWTNEGKILFSSNRRKKVFPMTTQFYEISISDDKIKESFNIAAHKANIMRVPHSTKYVVIALYDNNAPDVYGFSYDEAESIVREYEDSPCYVFDEVPFWCNGLGITNGTRHRLYIYDALDASLVAITDSYEDVSDVRVYEDGRMIYMGTKYGKDRDKPRYKGVFLYDIRSKDKQCLINDNERRIDAVEMIGSELILATTEGELYGTEQYCDFYRMDIYSRKLIKIADYGYSVNFPSVGTDARLGGGLLGKAANDKMYFITTISDSAILRSVDRNGLIEDVFKKEGSVDSFDVFGEKIVVCGMYDNKLAELYDENGKQLTSINKDIYENYLISVPEFRPFINKTGICIHGWVIKPIGYKKGEKYPAILDIHGGPRRAFGTLFFHEMQCWAADGYFILFCNPEGGDGFGQQFGYLSGSYGTRDYDDVMEFVDYVVKTYSDIDDKRMGVTGGSYGGFMTNWIIGHSHRFKAAVSQRSISNWILFEHTSDQGYMQTKSQQLVTTREDQEKLWSFSPLKYADKATTPTLFIHSMEDYRCNMMEGISMFSALKQNKVDTRLCLFKGESHELSRSGRPKGRIRRLEEIKAWFDKYLKA